jgi:hypothetical protein
MIGVIDWLSLILKLSFVAIGDYFLLEFHLNVKRNAPENWRTNVKTCCCFFVRNTGMFLK